MVMFCSYNILKCLLYREHLESRAGIYPVTVYLLGSLHVYSNNFPIVILFDILALSQKFKSDRMLKNITHCVLMPQYSENRVLSPSLSER